MLTLTLRVCRSWAAKLWRPPDGAERYHSSGINVKVLAHL